MVNQIGCYYFLEDFGDRAKKRDRSVVVATGVVPRLKDWNSFTSFEFGGEHTC